MFPQAFVKRIQDQFKDHDHFLNALEQPFVTSIRKHPLKGKEVSPGPYENIDWCKHAFYLKERPVFTLDPLFHAGAYYVQESSSMFIWEILDQLYSEKNIRILDLCAAPGGKSTLIASWLNGSGLLVSNEVIKSRANILLENITKWGYNNTWVTSTDAYVLGGLNEFFDCIVLDAPCSGEGLFRRDKAAINEWSEANCDLCASRQRKIVAEVLPALNEGGYMIYSTCTFNPAENDKNINWMLKEFPLELVSIQTNLFNEITNTETGHAFYPHKTKGEGFFCCVLRKTGGIKENESVRKQKTRFEKFNQKDLSLNNFVKDPDRFSFFINQQKIAAIPKNIWNDLEEVSGITKILGGFLCIGEIKGKDLIPDHSLAMSIDRGDPFLTIEIEHQDALYYLARKEFKLESRATGWATIIHKGEALGFVKQLPNRFNNYYPVDWRIRMDV